MWTVPVENVGGQCSRNKYLALGCLAGVGSHWGPSGPMGPVVSKNPGATGATDSLWCPQPKEGATLHRPVGVGGRRVRWRTCIATSVASSLTESTYFHSDAGLQEPRLTSTLSC